MRMLTLQERSQRLNAKLRDHATRSLEKIIAASATTPSMRRAATLRLSRLRAASKPAPAIKAAPATTRTKAAPAPTADAVFEAVQAYRALSAQRSALINKRKTAGEREILHTMIALMPPTVPEGSDPTQWRNFVSQIDGLLTQIKSIKNP
jgi:hypothetical protein